jgi:hypothetical protein
MMKYLPLLFLLGSTAFADEPALMQVGELPGQKKAELIQPRERNPFMRREAMTTADRTDKESEESKLREVFKTLSVTGVIRGGGEMKVLLVNLILKQGEPLPPLIEDQTEQLIVGPITERQVEIDFIETDDRAEPRKILIPIDLRPRVAISPATIAPAPQPSNADHSQAVLPPAEQ